MTVKVYSTPTCPWCHKLKEWLKSRKIEFVDIDISEDEAAQREMISRSGQMGVPQVDVDGRMIIGFDPDAIEDALRASPDERMEEEE